MAEIKNIEHRDEIRVKGIRSQGYGHMPKIVMLDSSLSLEAKAIYAYFCSFTGSGNNTAFPGRDRILHDLDISKGRYYRHFTQLTDNGYITVEQKAGDPGHPGFKHNVYTLENYPAKFDTIHTASETMTKAYAQIRNVKDISAAGYGTVPKSVMISGVPIEAKGIYAYFCVFSGADYESTPSRDTMLYHLDIAHNAFNKYIKTLVEANYLSKLQSISNGKFGSVTYHLNQNALDKIADRRTECVELPQPQNEYTQNEDSRIGDTQITSAQNTDTQNRDAVFTPTQFEDIITPRVNKTKIIKTSFNQSFMQTAPEQMEGMNEVNEKEIIAKLLEEKTISENFTHSPNVLTCVVRYLTEWDLRSEVGFYHREIATKVYRLFVDCLVEMMTEGTVTLIQGIKVSALQVRTALCANYLEIGTNLSGMDYADLEDLPDKVCENFLTAAETRKITNQKAYLKTVIWTTLQNPIAIF